jgi:hypothetical protein
VWYSTAANQVSVTYGERGDEDEDAEGTAGVREPRKPRSPHDTTGAALDLPRAEDALSPTSVDHVSVA